MPASYPTTAKVFTTKSDGPGNTILAAHVNDLQLEVTAIEQDLVAGLPAARGGTGAVTLTANGVLYGNGTGAVQAATGTAGQVLSFSGAGVPVASDLPSGDAQVALTAQVFS
jgi:hypothetical protein